MERKNIGKNKNVLEQKEIKEKLVEANKTIINGQTQLFRAEKLAAVGQLAAGAAHEINNPLFVISAEAEMLAKDKEKDEETRKSAMIIFEQTKRIKEITTRLLEFSRKKMFVRKAYNVNDILADAIQLLKYQARLEGIKIIEELKPDLPKVFCDKNQIQEAFLNIMLNALQAMEKGGILTIKTDISEVTDLGRRKTDKFTLGEKILIVVFEDIGQGMDHDTLLKIFNPFFTTKNKGTGLGLSVSYAIIDNHGGMINAQSELGKGSKFTIQLPIMKGTKNV